MSAELINPVSGECYEVETIDQMVRALTELRRQVRELYGLQHTISRLIAECVEVPKDFDVMFNRSLRLQTEAHSVKLHWSPPRWDRQQLEALYQDWPKLRQQYLAISLRVRLGAVKILMKSQCTGPLKKFRSQLEAARIMEVPTPRITLENDRDGPTGFGAELGFASDGEEDGE